jgi:predicted transposase/invertase (TIGR01784 family)
LARFLTVVLKIPIEADELTIIHTEFSPEYLADKASRLDIQVRRSEFHQKMNVEMQQVDEKRNIERRILYYWGKSYTEDLKERENYETLPRMVSIVIMDFDVFEWKDVTKFHGVFRVTEQSEGDIFSDALEIHTLELPKLKRQPLKEDWEALECWCLYLNNMEGEVMEKVAEMEPMIRRAITVEDVFMKNEEERRLYELREKGRRDYENAIQNSERRGKLEGLRAGELKGELKGKLEVARSMLARGMPLQEVSEIAGLPIDRLQDLVPHS